MNLFISSFEMSMRKRIIQNCLLFAVLAILINMAAYQFLAKPVLFRDYFIPKKNLNKFTNFMMGDSHAGVIQQQDLNALGITNFSFNSESYFDVYNKLNHLIRNHSVDTIYLCVDDHTLSLYRQYWTNAQRSIYFSDYQHYKRYYKTNLRQFLYKKYISIHLPFFDTSHSLILRKRVGALLKREKTRNYDNYDFSKVPVEQRLRRSQQRINTQYPGPEISESLSRCLVEMISLCEQEDITLIGVKFPLTREFYEELGDRSYGADSIFKAHHLSVYDYKRIFLDSISYFRDQDHLNLKGSELFTELFLKE